MKSLMISDRAIPLNWRRSALFRATTLSNTDQSRHTHFVHLLIELTKWEHPFQIAAVRMKNLHRPTIVYAAERHMKFLNEFSSMLREILVIKNKVLWNGKVLPSSICGIRAWCSSINTTQRTTVYTRMAIEHAAFSVCHSLFISERPFGFGLQESCFMVHHLYISVCNVKSCSFHSPVSLFM